jgi:hypothetical protein
MKFTVQDTQRVASITRRNVPVLAVVAVSGDIKTNPVLDQFFQVADVQGSARMRAGLHNAAGRRAAFMETCQHSSYQSPGYRISFCLIVGGGGSICAILYAVQVILIAKLPCRHSSIKLLRQPEYPRLGIAISCTFLGTLFCRQDDNEENPNRWVSALLR